MMRFILSSCALAVALLTGSVAGAAVTFSASGSTTGGDLNAVAISDTITIDIRLSSDGTATFGLGAAVFGYDTNVVQFAGGQAVSGYLFDVCIPGAGCFNGLDNLEGGALNEDTNFVDPKVQIANSASLNGRIGTGALDPGLDGVIGGNDAMFRVSFTATGAGVTTFQIGTDASTGNVIVFQGGATEQATNSSITVTVVPEPGTALLMGLGLAGLGLAGSRRE